MRHSQVFLNDFEVSGYLMTHTCEYLIWLLKWSVITRDAHRAGRVKVWVGYLFFFFFFVVATNLHINLFIKLSPLLEEMYCSHCAQQKRPNENLLLARISRGRGPPHPYLCDVKSSFDLFIKPGLNSLLVAAILFTSFRLNYAVSKRNLTLLKRQMERSTSQKHSTGKTVEIGEFLAKESCFV